MGNKVLRVAVVGLGKMGWLHASLLNVLPNVHLAALCENSSVTRKLAGKVFRSTPVVGRVSEFSDFDLDAVFVTTPTDSHFEVAKTVYQEGLARHVFIEKPLSSTADQSKQLCELADLNKGTNMVGYLRRFMVTFIKAKDLLAIGAIGDPLSFSLGAYSSDFYGLDTKSAVSINRGGVLRDLGSYAIDITKWFFDPVLLESSKIDSLNGLGSEDAAHFNVYRESDSLRGEIAVSWCVDGYRMPEVDLTIVGSKGVIEVNDDKTSLRTKDGEKTIWYRHNLADHVQFWLGLPEYYREDYHFINAAVTNSSVEPSFKTAEGVDLFIETIRQKAREHV